MRIAISIALVILLFSCQPKAQREIERYNDSMAEADSAFAPVREQKIKFYGRLRDSLTTRLFTTFDGSYVHNNFRQAYWNRENSFVVTLWFDGTIRYTSSLDSATKKVQRHNNVRLTSAGDTVYLTA